jgi:hypothetical protein
VSKVQITILPSIKTKYIVNGEKSLSYKLYVNDVQINYFINWEEGVKIDYKKTIKLGKDSLRFPLTNMTLNCINGFFEDEKIKFWLVNRESEPYFDFKISDWYFRSPSCIKTNEKIIIQGKELGTIKPGRQKAIILYQIAGKNNRSNYESIYSQGVTKGGASIGGL